MRRSLLAIPVALALLAGVAGVSGAFSSSPSTSTGSASTTMPMQMPMPTTSAAATPAKVALHQKVVHVLITNFKFEPAHVVVSPGARVVWTNQDSDPHTVTTDRPGFSSQALDTGQQYAMVLTHAGTITYHCTIHPFMHGAVTVQG